MSKLIIFFYRFERKLLFYELPYFIIVMAVDVLALSDIKDVT